MAGLTQKQKPASKAASLSSYPLFRLCTLNSISLRTNPSIVSPAWSALAASFESGWSHCSSVLARDGVGRDAGCLGLAAASRNMKAENKKKKEKRKRKRGGKFRAENVEPRPRRSVLRAQLRAAKLPTVLGRELPKSACDPARARAEEWRRMPNAAGERCRCRCSSDLPRPRLRCKLRTSSGQGLCPPTNQPCAICLVLVPDARFLLPFIHHRRLSSCIPPVESISSPSQSWSGLLPSRLRLPRTRLGTCRLLPASLISSILLIPLLFRSCYALLALRTSLQCTAGLPSSPR